MNSTFDKFVAIDWSGAMNPGDHIQVASCRPGRKPPNFEPPPDRHWSRTDVLSWLVSQGRKLRLLVGFDFAFAYPYCDQKAYFPSSDRSPQSASDLWSAVESICTAGEDLYGGPIYRDPGSPFHEYFRRRGHIGEHYRQRLRETERVCATKPLSPFKCIGADQVGPGSVAGMRLLHAIETFHRDLFSIWPFQGAAAGKSVVVEIFPRLFFKLTDVSFRDPGRLLRKSLVRHSQGACRSSQALSTR